MRHETEDMRQEIGDKRHVQLVKTIMGKNCLKKMDHNSATPSSGHQPDSSDRQKICSFCRYQGGL